jgi:formylmethanofuran dehydrogenase subunit E
MSTLESHLEASARLHRHMCPRQVLGVRMGLLAGQLLDLPVPQSGKRLLTIAETDGCAVDGIAVATNCWVGRRTLRIEDYGKIAATFVDVQRQTAVRIVPSPQARELAESYAPDARSRWEAYLIGYQRMPDADLFVTRWVRLVTPIEAIISRPGKQALCTGCGEEVINGREVMQDGEILCRACAGSSYYATVCCTQEPESAEGLQRAGNTSPTHSVYQ